MEGEVYAVETFPTLGTNKLTSLHECNHFMIKEHIRTQTGDLRTIYDERKTLAFCPRWFKCPIPESPYITKYPILEADGLVAQTEHTIFIHAHKVEVLN